MSSHRRRRERAHLYYVRLAHVNIATCSPPDLLLSTANHLQAQLNSQVHLAHPTKPENDKWQHSNTPPTTTTTSMTKNNDGDSMTFTNALCEQDSGARCPWQHAVQDWWQQTSKATIQETP